MMRLNDLLATIHVFCSDETPIHTITTHHQDAAPGVLFVALVGYRFDSHCEIPSVLRAGAAVLGSVKEDHVYYVPDTKLVLPHLAEAFYGYPHQFVKMIGVTGTNGKSSVTNFIASLLRMMHKRVCLIGGDGIFLEERYLPTSNTTPSALELSGILATCIAEEVEYVVMEVSSHAIEQGRVSALYYDALIFLNLGHDHLDYHPSFYQYKESKMKLLQQLKPHGHVLVNGDDRELLSILEEGTTPVALFGRNQAQYRIENPMTTAASSSFTLAYEMQAQRITLSLLSIVNVYNVSAAIAVLHQLGFSFAELCMLACSLRPMAGRLEVVVNEPFTVLIDYAHTVEAFQTLGAFIQSCTAQRKCIVMGLGGNRDQAKRPLIGVLLHQYFDVLIYTSDNPREEDPQAIIDDLCQLTGFERVLVEIDRKTAIERAIKMAGNGDIIVIAGRGNEAYQWIGSQKIPFQDKQVVMQALKLLDS